MTCPTCDGEEFIAVWVPTSNCSGYWDDVECPTCNGTTWAVRAQEQGSVKQVLLVHGEPGPADALAATLRAAGLPQVSVPARGHLVDV